MASLLDSYEQQYGIITASITARTAKLSTASAIGKFKLPSPSLLIIPSFGWFISGDDRRVVIQQIEKEIEEARDIVGIALN